MKRTVLKITSTLLAASMALSFAACSKQGKSGRSNSNSSGSKTRNETHSGEKISADTPWFDGNVIDVKIPYDDSKPVEYTYPSLAGVDDKYIVAYLNGYYKMPNGNDIDWDNFNYNDYSISILGVMDRDTKQIVNTIDLSKDIPKNGYVESVSYANGKATVRISTYDDLTYNVTTVETDIDPLSGSVLEKRDVENNNDGSWIEHTFYIKDTKVETSINWDNNDNAYYIIYVTSPDGSKNSIELKEAGVNIYDIPVILPFGDDLALVPASTDRDYRYYELDIKNGTIKPADEKEYSWLDLDSIYSSYTSPEGIVYYSTPTGISKIDIKKKSTEEMFNYSWCGVNRSLLNYLSIVECSDDGFVLAGEKYESSPYSYSSNSSFVVVEFTKAAKNPHAGKTILEMYSSYGYVEDNIGDAIIKYNESSKDYFIEVTDRYSNLDDIDYNNINSEDEWQNANLKSNAEMSNALAMDILNGEGPDLLLNTSELGQLNNTNYLADLTPYIGKLDPSKYFTNVVDASMVDGKLFQLPLCFMIEGIQTDPKYAGASGVGFTTEEYEKFLNETLNGTDVIPMGQALYFTKLFDAMSEKFIKDGKADFTGPEFAQLAEYVKNNVQESSKSWDEMYPATDDYYIDTSVAVGAPVKGDIGYSNETAVYTTTYGIGGYFMQMAQTNGATAILGIPSTDGRGPQISPYISIAVSAQAQDVDACGEFVKLLLSDDIQKSMAENDNLVLLRDAFRAGGAEAVEYYNGEGGEGMFGYDYNTGMPVENRLKFSEKNIDDMEKIIESCSGLSSPDASINLILVEEMQPYFIGQKSLDDVIRIAQDRVQKVIDERG